MPVPAPERKKHKPPSTNQDESNDGDRQSQNPQHQNQIAGGIHSNQKEYAEKVVHPNSSNGQSSRNPQAPSHPEQQRTFSEVIPKPTQFPQFPTHQQQPKQSIPVTPPRNDPARRQEPQPISLTIVIHPPPQNPGNLPSRNPVQPVVLPPVYNMRPDDTTHKQPQPTPENQISTYKNKHPEEGTAHEQPVLKKPGQAPGPQQPGPPPPENQNSTYTEPTAHKQQIPKKPGEAPGLPPRKPGEDIPLYDKQKDIAYEKPAPPPPPGFPPPRNQPPHPKIQPTPPPQQTLRSGCCSLL